jgi:TolB-like protein
MHRNLLLIALLVGGSGGTPAAAARAAPPRLAVGVVRFVNATGAPEAMPLAMAAIEAALRERGIEPRGGSAAETFLRERRLRARNALAAEESRDLAATLGTRYLLVGSLTSWSMSRGPRVGFTARIVDTERGTTVWAGSVSFHAIEAPGLLARGRPRTLGEASVAAARDLVRGIEVREVEGEVRLVASLRKPHARWRTRPIVWKAPDLAGRRPLRIAVLPFENRTLRPEASAIVAERFLAGATALPRIEVVDPGELRRLLIENDIQPVHGLGALELEILERALNLDAVLDGAILAYDDGGALAPRVDIHARLRTAPEGEVLWSATTSRGGHETWSIYDIGRIESVDRLAADVVGELLATWF